WGGKKTNCEVFKPRIGRTHSRFSFLSFRQVRKIGWQGDRRSSGCIEAITPEAQIDWHPALLLACSPQRISLIMAKKLRRSPSLSQQETEMAGATRTVCFRFRRGLGMVGIETKRTNWPKQFKIAKLTGVAASRVF